MRMAAGVQRDGRATSVQGAHLFLIMISILFTYTHKPGHETHCRRHERQHTHLPLPLQEAETPNTSIRAQFWGFGPFSYYI